MTGIDTCSTTHGGREPPVASERSKSILICPTCGFESAAGENWILRSGSETREFVCPDCGTEVASRQLL